MPPAAPAGIGRFFVARQGMHTATRGSTLLDPGHPAAIARIPLHCRGLQASDRVYYLYQTLADIADTLGSSPEGQAALAAAQAQAQLAGSSPGGGLLAEVQAALADDFNTPLVVAAFSSPLKAANDLLQTKKASTAHACLAPATWISPQAV